MSSNKKFQKAFPPANTSSTNGSHHLSIHWAFYNAASQMAQSQGYINSLRAHTEAEKSLPPLKELTEIEQSLSDLLTEQEKQPAINMNTARQKLILTLHAIKDKKISQAPQSAIDLGSRLGEANRNWERAAAAWIKSKDTKERPSFAAAFYIQRSLRRKLNAARTRAIS